MYGLTPSQYERQESLDSGYEVQGEYNSIATELQDECEADDRVLYPVHIESDVYHEEDPATLIEWFREFVEDYLDVPSTLVRCTSPESLDSRPCPTFRFGGKSAGTAKRTSRDIL